MKRDYDIIILGAGIVGLLSAYELNKAGKSVLVVDKSTVGNHQAASSGITRSLRNDYEDPRYAALARKAWDQWFLLEQELSAKFLVKTGCLNISSTISKSSYAREAAVWLKRDDNTIREYADTRSFTSVFPQFSEVTYGVLDIEAGMGLAGRSLEAICAKLGSMKAVDIVENQETLSVRKTSAGNLLIQTDQEIVTAQQLVIAAGLGSSDILNRVEGNKFELNLRADKPIECLYYQPANTVLFKSDKLPIFANLDLGVYGHPIIQGITNAVKIGMYAPPEIVTAKRPDSISSVKDFVERYLPQLADNAHVSVVTDTDQCAYDMTPDGNFVIGKLPDNDDITIAAGFCGTGFKFAPVTAEIVRRLVLGQEMPYDLSAFTPHRF